MKINISDILEIHQIDEVREELDLCTQKFYRTKNQKEKHELVVRMRQLIGQLERHNYALKKSMLVLVR